MNRYLVDKMIFLAGNFEAQRLAGYHSAAQKSYKEVILATVKNHFIYSCLLADFVLQPSAHYYQSEITQFITRKYRAFFRPYKTFPPVASYAVSYRRGTFEEDAVEKATSYTDNFACYKDPRVRKDLSIRVSEISEPFIRKGQLANSLSDTILRDSASNGKLHDFVLVSTDDASITEKILYPLQEICKEQRYALIPEYLETKITNKTPLSYVKLMRLSLLESYTNIVGQLYDAYPHNALYPFYNHTLFPYELNYLDTHLFHKLICLVPELEETINRGTDKQILDLKYSEGFQYFRQHYKGIVEQLQGATMQEYMKVVLHDYDEEKVVYQARLDDLLKNRNLMSMFHESLTETISNKRSYDIRNLISFVDLPIFGFVTEVMERFTGKYERMLGSRLSNLVHVSNTPAATINAGTLILSGDATVKISKQVINNSQVNMGDSITSPTFTLTVLSSEVVCNEITTLISKHADPQEKGELLAALDGVTAGFDLTEDKRKSCHRIRSFLNNLVEGGKDILSDTTAKFLAELAKQS